MKQSAILIAMLLFSASTPALADSRTIEIDGELYRCELVDGRTPDGAIKCANKAYSGPFSKEESRKLCEGARSEAPADCAMKAYSGMFNKEESITLCQRARSTGPADCSALVYQGPFNKDEALQLCAHPRATVRNAECALEAYRGPYSKEESIAFCREGGRRPGRFTAQPEFLKNSEILKLKQEQLVIEANLKAFKLNEYKR